MRMTTYIFNRPFVIALAVACMTLGLAQATVVPVSPIGGETLALLPEAQKKIMAFATYEERLAAIKADKAKPHAERFYCKDPETTWRTSAPLVLKWQTTDGEKGPWRILIGTSPDFANARELWPNPEEKRKMAMAGDSSMSEKAQGNVRCYTYEVPRPNLELDRTYYWRHERHFDKGFAKYGDEKTPWNERIRLYLLDCGVTEEEIATFREIMLED